MGDVRETLELHKRRTYMVILLVGLAGASLAWLANEVNGTISPFTRAVFLVTVAFLALQVWLIRGRRVRIELVDNMIYFFVSAIVLCVLGYATYGLPPSDLREISLLSLFLWVPLVYVFVFLAYERMAALLRSSLLYALILALSLPHAFATWDSDAPFESFNAVGQLYISSAAIIAVLFSFTRMRDRLREAQVVADHLATLAQTDALTEVSNRRHIESLLELEMERASRYGSHLSFIAFDLDNFKQINDTLGHDAGDAVLIEVARLIEPHLRASDRLGRWGGEEFVILTTGTPVESAWQLAERIRTTLENHAFEPGVRLSASFGVATYRPGESASMLVKRSDVALYRAKTRGKNRVEMERISA